MRISTGGQFVVRIECRDAVGYDEWSLSALSIILN